MTIDPVRDFILQPKGEGNSPWTAVSLFAGAGLSDLGYEMAGFGFVVQVEADAQRAAIGADNFPRSTWLACDVRGHADTIAAKYQERTSERLGLLVATPPCQGMSSSNPSRGKRETPGSKALEEKNRLLLEVVPVARTLVPRVIVIENVRQVLTLEVEDGGRTSPVLEILRNGLKDYDVFPNVVNVADYGVPQIRRRALVVAVHKKEAWLEGMRVRREVLIPAPSHSEHPGNGEQPWVSIREWLECMAYEPLDSRAKESARGADPLHFVPAYGTDRYRQVCEIPPYSGLSAYENSVCPACGGKEIEIGLMHCPTCGGLMRNRPYVQRMGRPALISGFKSSYRRMFPDRPAYTVTTNSSHIGSDFKIHPWEHRVLSILECSDIQTVPRFYDWTRAFRNRRNYLIRNLIGEAFPTYFTYLHGRTLAERLSSSETSSDSNGMALTRRC